MAHAAVEVNSEAEFDQFLSNNQFVVIDFYADWCGPCKAFAPDFENFAKANTNIKFLKVNVDNQEEIAVMYDVKAMPTFTFIKNKTTVKTQVGAKKEEFEANLKLLA